MKNVSPKDRTAEAAFSTDAFAESFLRAMVELANKTREGLTGDFAQVRAIIDGAQVVTAIWQDANEPHGVGCMLIRGQHYLREIVADGDARRPKMAAIPCISLEQAEALRQVAGEQDGRH